MLRKLISGFVYYSTALICMGLLGAGVYMIGNRDRFLYYNHDPLLWILLTWIVNAVVAVVYGLPSIILIAFLLRRWVRQHAWNASWQWAVAGSCMTSVLVWGAYAFNALTEFAVMHRWIVFGEESPSLAVSIVKLIVVISSFFVTVLASAPLFVDYLYLYGRYGPESVYLRGMGVAISMIACIGALTAFVLWHADGWLRHKRTGTIT